MRLLLSMILFLISVWSHAATVQVANSHITEQYDGTQLVFDFDTKPDYDGFLLDDPPRFVIDVRNAHLKIPTHRINRLRSSDVLGVRTGIKNGTDLRIVMDLSTQIRTKTTMVHHNGYHLVVDFFRQKVKRAAYTRSIAKPQIVKPKIVKSVERQKPAPIDLVSQRAQPQKRRETIALVSKQTAPVSQRSPIPARVPKSSAPRANNVRSNTENNSRIVEKSIVKKNSQPIKLASLEKPLTTTSKKSRAQKREVLIIDKSPINKPKTNKPKAVAKVTSPPPATSSPIPNSQRGPIVVAIDAGHGGKDPGARGPGGTKEKHVTMKIAKQLANLINKQKGMRACLTRTKDVYLKLYKRIDVARTKCKADLFVSIHADAFYEPDPRGASVYVLSTKSASSAMARWLAKTENKADNIGGSLKIKDKKLRKVVLDMVQDASLAESRTLAQKVLRHLGKVGKLHSRKVERAGFAVLKSPEMPSILVETAFISNPKEEQKLRNRSYQKKLAKAILGGIREYAKQRPQLTQPQPVIAVR